jgi:hypothetical protein
MMARKLVRGAIENMYATTELEYYLHSEDVRVIDMKHSKLQVRKSARNVAGCNKEIFIFDEEEMETLKKRCWTPM